MTDIRAGAKVRAADYPPTVGASDSTAQNNITSTSYITGSPTVSVAFVAPTSGQVLVTVGMGARDDGGVNRAHLAPVVRLGNSGGTTVLAADVTTRGVGSVGEAKAFHYASRTSLLSGLTPGATYYAETRHKVSGGSSADIATRDIAVVPVPLGGGRAGSEILALDMPPAVQAIDTTQINNPGNTSYTSGTPEVGAEFIAPTSGRVLLIVGGGLGNGAGNRVFLSPQVWWWSGVDWVEVLAPGVPARGFAAHSSASGFHFGSRETLLEGLTPGAFYYAWVMHVMAGDGGAAVGDIACRQITVVPVS
ncbi:hypothetical protein [Sphaerimonospora thailandensis]|uniref:Uncharacterized protein n=1 Tax=Sphaerimonospora thailandensis TaxID=795644 RepID=A0A8J3VZ19_9ACTN|nr:hypothetical protein [Sphaerimonospora thailandensis]GIH69436.1 hypothetical protein Mth01_16890 [Sphaerimonospora thailandensis]